jgi:hypothetical protein
MMLYLCDRRQVRRLASATLLEHVNFHLRNFDGLRQVNIHPLKTGRFLLLYCVLKLK